MSQNTTLKIKQMSAQLLVTDIEQSIAFYTQQLGFDLQFRYEDFYAGIIKDDRSIHLKTGQPSIEERKRKQENNDLDLIFSIEGVDALYQDFTNKGINILQPLCEQPYGREFYIIDPDEYVLAFLQELH